MVDIQEIERLIELMEASGLMELEVESGDFKVALRRGEKTPNEPKALSVTEETFEAEVDGLEETEASAVARHNNSTVFATPVISPLVGIFHNGGMPERRAILSEGDTVEEGQVIGVIEAMKVPNELRSPVDGIIGQILAEDGAGVEYGQTLFLIEPAESEAEAAT